MSDQVAACGLELSPAESSAPLPNTDIYLDANATTPALPEVLDAVIRTMGAAYGNPSSAHWIGAKARAVLEQARDDVVSLVCGADPEGVVFTSGGTEGNNTLVSAVLSSGYHLLTTSVEHPSVLQPASRARSAITLLEVSRDGLVHEQVLADALRASPGPVCLSVQWANSETGVIQPLASLFALARQIRPDVLVHSDIAQAIGRVRVDLREVSVDAATFSGHKLHGPQGTGAIILRDPSEARLKPLLLGGGQERGWRSGTQNVAGAAGLGVAARSRAEQFQRAASALQQMRDSFEQRILDRLPRARVNGSCAPRVPNTSSICFPGVEAMQLLARLDAKGIACSAGSACSAARPEPSHVLSAMGLSERDAFSSIRFSFSILNTMTEVVRAAALVVQTVGEVA